MSEQDQPSAKDIFNTARVLGAEERSAYLDQACSDDPGLRSEVEQLLADYEAAGSFLESPTLPMDRAALENGDATSPVAAEPTELPGTMIGRYKVLQAIGEGGFGRVYMAEQTEPVVRRVALKVIKLGMDTRQVIARFEAERQALAMMDHPNIAKVLDAGATSEGRPFFVMELVKGDPITEYCDRNSLSIPERLDLFMQVCRAVQHAHQKGIIHRDIKPSNVLVTIADGRPVPKVIDFGIAKATNARLTEKTLFTEFRQLIGTPQYMSPEQAEAIGVDIDTRSDIYSLGVLLYELLTGTTPFDPQRLRSAAFGEIQRIIREEEPPKPSTRLSTLDTLPSIATHRRVEAKRLGSMMRGDLDWIVMKCLEKDRTRRYETADALALEMQRHLDCEPVVAGPPSRMYRVRKFVRRHRMGVAASVAIALTLVLGVIGTSAATAWALNERTTARANEERAMEEAERAIALLNLTYNLGVSHLQEGNNEAAHRLLSQLLELQLRFYGEDDRRTLGTMTNLGLAHERSGQLEEAKDLLVRSYARKRDVYGSADPWTWTAANALSRIYEAQGAEQEAFRVHREWMEARRQLSALPDATPGRLRSTAHALLTHPIEELRDPEHALSLAVRACELTEFSNPYMLETLARAHYFTGNSSEALRIELLAIDLLPLDAPDRDAFESRRDHYRAALDALFGPID